MDGLITKVYERYILDDNWVGENENIEDFSDEYLEIHTSRKSADVVKNVIREAICNKDRDEILVPLNAEAELSSRVAFSVEIFDDEPNDIAVFFI